MNNEQKLKDKIIEAVGWAYADCCATLDKGGDPRQTDMADVLVRVQVDLKLDPLSSSEHITS